MLKKLLLVTGMMMLFAAAVSADWPLPPCFPDPTGCPMSSSAR